MIVGKGDIASVLNDRYDIIFFASGVSNSSETRDSEFQKEIDLLLKQDKSKCVYYFSSIALDISDKVVNRYYLHKLQMEALIKSNFENYVIIRIGNINWGKNPNTFLNAMRNKIMNNEPVHIVDEYRYIINKEQLLLMTDNLPSKGQHQISVFGRMAKVRDLLK
jgi:hypothetical protein